MATSRGGSVPEKEIINVEERAKVLSSKRDKGQFTKSYHGYLKDCIFKVTEPLDDTFRGEDEKKSIINRKKFFKEEKLHNLEDLLSLSENDHYYVYQRLPSLLIPALNNLNDWIRTDNSKQDLHYTLLQKLLEDLSKLVELLSSPLGEMSCSTDFPPRLRSDNLEKDKKDDDVTFEEFLQCPQCAMEYIRINLLESIEEIHKDYYGKKDNPIDQEEFSEGIQGLLREYDSDFFRETLDLYEKSLDFALEVEKQREKEKDKDKEPEDQSFLLQTSQEFVAHCEEVLADNAAGRDSLEEEDDEENEEETRGRPRVTTFLSPGKDEWPKRTTKKELHDIVLDYQSTAFCPSLFGRFRSGTIQALRELANYKVFLVSVDTEEEIKTMISGSLFQTNPIIYKLANNYYLYKKGSLKDDVLLSTAEADNVINKARPLFFSGYRNSLTLSAALLKKIHADSPATCLEGLINVNHIERAIEKDSFFARGRRKKLFHFNTPELNKNNGTDKILDKLFYKFNGGHG